MTYSSTFHSVKKRRVELSGMPESTVQTPAVESNVPDLDDSIDMDQSMVEPTENSSESLASPSQTVVSTESINTTTNECETLPIDNSMRMEQVLNIPTENSIEVSDSPNRTVVDALSLEELVQLRDQLRDGLQLPCQSSSQPSPERPLLSVPAESQMLEPSQAHLDRRPLTISRVHSSLESQSASSRLPSSPNVVVRNVPLRVTNRSPLPAALRIRGRRASTPTPLPMIKEEPEEGKENRRTIH